MIQILLLCTLLPFTTAQDPTIDKPQVVQITPSLCMDDFLAVDMDKLFSNQNTNQKLQLSFNPLNMTHCYLYMENFRTKVHGFNIYSQCYVDEQYLYVERTDNQLIDVDNGCN